MRTSPNTAAIDTEIIKKKHCLPSGSLRQAGTSGKKCLHLHCQPLNEVWEGVDPGSTPSSHSGAWLTPELPWVGPAFPPGVQSLLQAMTQHFHYKLRAPRQQLGAKSWGCSTRRVLPWMVAQRMLNHVEREHGKATQYFDIKLTCQNCSSDDTVD